MGLVRHSIFQDLSQMSKKDAPIMLELWPYPDCVLYAPIAREEHVWLQKRYRFPEAEMAVMDTGGARATEYVRDLSTIYVVKVNTLALSEHDMLVRAGLAAHEALHVCDFLFEGIGEQRAGAEVRAYLIQALTQFILTQWGAVALPRKPRVTRRV